MEEAATDRSGAGTSELFGGAPGTGSGRLLRFRAARAFIRVPLFYKIVLGNALFLAVAVLTAAALARSGPAAPLSTASLLVALLGLVLVSVVFNAGLVSLALVPLRRLEETARRVREGNLAARAPRSPLADRQMEGVVAVFNHMLDSVEALRRRHRELTVRALEAEERERRWIAGRLYDETAQVLAAVLLRLRIVVRAATADGRGGSAAGMAELARLRAELAEALNGVRRLARELRPPEIEEVGVTAALVAHARLVQEATGIPVRVTGALDESDLPGASAVALYRILQEALSNAVRHARPGEVEIRLSTESGRIQAEVRDDGVGFDAEAIRQEASQGLGLFALSERAALLGGTATVESEPGSGTRIRVLLPTRRPFQSRSAERSAQAAPSSW